MNRISIDVTLEQHQKLKALAALKGRTIKQFALESTLGAQAQDDLEALESLLDERIADAKRRKGEDRKTLAGIFQEAQEQISGGS